jgi:Protein of unknown function (DUF3551)
MKQLLKLTAAPAMALVASAFVSFAAPTDAQAGQYCRRDVTSYMLSCSFDTLAQCQAMSSGRGGDCLRDPFLADRTAFAYAPGQLPSRHVTHRARTHAE